MNEWMNEWMPDWLTEWMNEWLAERLTMDIQTEWMNEWMAEPLTMDILTDWLTWQMADWLTERQSQCSAALSQFLNRALEAWDRVTSNRQMSMRGHEECHFSGVTKYGRVWRKARLGVCSHCFVCTIGHLSGSQERSTHSHSYTLPLTLTQWPSHRSVTPCVCTWSMPALLSAYTPSRFLGSKTEGHSDEDSMWHSTQLLKTAM